MGLSRRGFVAGASALGGLALLPTRAWWSSVFAAAPARPGAGPYGPMLAPDANGLQLPAGFTSRVIATTGETVGSTSHVWHAAPDGGGCVARAAGGWIYVSNSEVPNDGGGASAVAFDESGEIADAYSILSGTSWNCSGGMTPWGTWLSCEERGSGGQVHECDPQQRGQGVVRPALGSFNHEAAAVDPVTGDVYLTEDHSEGRLYRFVPHFAGDLSAGTLYAVRVEGGVVRWLPTSTDRPDRQPTTTAFNGGEGIHMGDGVVYFATKGDRRIWELDTRTLALSVAYDCLANPRGSLDAVDNVTVHEATGRVFIAEDGGNMELGVMADVGGAREVAAFCRVAGHGGSEVTGPAFSPDGRRLYLSSQRGADGATGVTYEITGPFDRTGPGGPVAGPVTVGFTDHAHVRGGTHAATNFAGSWLLHVCNNGSDEYTRWAYLRADTGAVSGPLARAVVRLSARLWTGDPSPMALHAVATDWSQSTLTWADRPAPDPTPIAAFTIESNADQWYEIDVTEHVEAHRAAGSDIVAFVIRQTEHNGKIAYVNTNAHPTDAPQIELTAAAAEPPSTSTTSTTSTTTTTTTVPAQEPIVVDVDDAYVRGGTHASTTFESTWVLQICDNSRDEYTRWTYLAADLPAATDGIGSAILRLNARMSSGGPSPMAVHGVDAGWDPAALTWRDRPLPGPEALAEFVVGSTRDEWYEIDVTAHVATVAAAGGRRVAFVVRQLERNGKVGYINSGSRSRRARLAVTGA